MAQSNGNQGNQEKVTYSEQKRYMIATDPPSLITNLILINFRFIFQAGSCMKKVKARQKSGDLTPAVPMLQTLCNVVCIQAGRTSTSG